MEPTDEQLTWAGAVLALNGVRHLTIDGRHVIGLWSDLDGPHIREALRLFDNQALPVLYLDGPKMPDRYKGRQIPGQPVPLDVVRAMLRATEPWVTRDNMLRAIDWHLKCRVLVPDSGPPLAHVV